MPAMASAFNTTLGTAQFVSGGTFRAGLSTAQYLDRSGAMSVDTIAPRSLAAIAKQYEQRCGRTISDDALISSSSSSQPGGSATRDFVNSSSVAVPWRMAADRLCPTRRLPVSTYTAAAKALHHGFGCTVYSGALPGRAPSLEANRLKTRP
ncbi:hypothetical protein CC78DRAFT_193126 [Lojkania enalia]|uniref:Uncharacterized protein n=1 Tax=Lojkania enalia TaxID=147567 RepID=A0A9P4TQK0_9PLEO|nr:hypothetical protein CC78DRAFT_193126 [Didymosphaeria enalia]